MAYLLDAVILIIIVLCVVRGVKKGFIKSAFSILTFLLAALLSFMFYVPFSEYALSTPAGQNISQSLHDSVYKAVMGEDKSANITPSENDAAEQSKKNSDITEKRDTAYENSTTEGIINRLKLPTFMFSSVMAQSDFLVRTAKVTAAEAVSSAVTMAFMKAISGILLFLLILIGLWILKKILELMFKMPLLRDVNKIAGGAAGFINGVLISYLLMAAVSSLSGFQELVFIQNTVNQSYIYQNFYQTNIIFSMFTR